MDPPCDFCGTQRALVYCTPDAARLCLPCDGFVHSANAIARRHLRAPLCDHCLSQPAVARSSGSSASLCRSCNRGSPGPQQQPVYGYSGCPSLPELSRIWPCAPHHHQASSLMASINEVDCGGACWDPEVNGGATVEFPTAGAPSGSEPSAGFGAQMGSSASLVPDVGPILQCSGDPEESIGLLHDQPIQPKGLNVLHHMGCPPLQDLAIYGDEGHYEGNNETFACPQSHPRYHFREPGVDGLFVEKNLSVADSNGRIENVVEDVNGNADQVLLCHNDNYNARLDFLTRNVYPNISISLSNQTGESSATSYQDCGISPIFLTGESACGSNMETSYPQARNEAKMRYNEKKKSRLFGKNIKYASRKARADTRKRVKGRFVKAGEGRDHDSIIRS